MRILLLLIVALLPLQELCSQGTQFQKTTKTEDGYTYESVSNDPLGMRLYTLKNGLKVYLSVYKDAPRIQTYIAVRAGSKNDPRHATGLAHYLEHILFKGTSKIGTQDWEKEKPELDKIEALYEVYRKTTDPGKRKDLYHQIDSISIVASGYSIANEYDKLLSGIGAQGTNAYTFFEQTVYVNDIPSNQLEKWAEIEAERFSEVVPRLFHTELEAVYEEKNKGMDQDRRKVWEAMMEELFRTHTYGTQTTIGTIDHLKNPSITEIKKYFQKYYVPGNVAICLSGDLQPSATIRAIEKYFGSWKGETPAPWIAPVEEPMLNATQRTIVGPDAESVSIAYRLEGYHVPGKAYETSVSKTPSYLKMLSMLLTNGQAGLIDLNLNQEQKILGGYCYDLPLNDYSVFVLGGKPREGQSLEEVARLLQAQLDSIKQGKFDDWLMKAVINDYKSSKMKEYEKNSARADMMVDAYISYRSWQQVCQEMENLERISKSDLMNFVTKNFQNNYTVLFKRKGVDTSMVKVPKPVISAVSLNRDKQSAFYTQLSAKSSKPIEPVFVDYEKDMKALYFKNNVDIFYKQNTENSLFSLTYVWQVKGALDPKYSLAMGWLDYLGTEKLSATELKKEFFKIGCSYGFSVSGDMISINLSGLHENFSAAMKLLEQLLKAPKADEEALQNMIADILKNRADNKLNKDYILKTGLVNFAKFGSSNPANNIIPETALKSIRSEELLALIKGLTKYKHIAWYYGPCGLAAVQKELETQHRKSGEFSFLQASKTFNHQELKENKVYFVQYDMLQAEIIFLSKSVSFNKDLVPPMQLFNEYFGGGMGSLVFQELRESRALAYSVRSTYQSASRKDDPNYVYSYIGTQADKFMEAIDGMIDLQENMPASDLLFENSKQSLIESFRTTRVTKVGVLSSYNNALQLGLQSDIRKSVYEYILKANMEDLKKFQQTYIKAQPRVILIIGNKSKIDMKKLEKYGPVEELSLEQLFGY
ncbi:MAG: insulinase family protein [Cytophagaceae bacterium]|jgi:predicted Zn-dependent peptidase|nr:insulinase family protein [Cytophagaceae bacterium]